MNSENVRGNVVVLLKSGLSSFEVQDFSRCKDCKNYFGVSGQHTMVLEDYKRKSIAYFRTVYLIIICHY